MPVIRLEDQHGIRLRIEGSLDIRSAADVRTALCKELTEDRAFALDASAVDECDAAGLQLLCSVLRSTGHNGPRVSLLGLSSAVTEAAEAIGMKFSEDLPHDL